MRTPPRHRHLACCLFLFACFLAGCVTPRPASNTPSLSPSSPQPVVDSLLVQRDDPLYLQIRTAFLEIRSQGDLTLAQSVLDSATVQLSISLSTASGERLVGLTRVVLELYRDLLPRTASLPPESPLSYLLGTLPPTVESEIWRHPYFQEFWIRKLAGTSDVPIDYTPEVVDFIRFFQTKGQGFFTRWLSRSGRYLPMIRKIFRDAGLPEDLAYKAMIESGFNPRAYSRARASGMWQFISHTGYLYRLRRNNWIDERRDPEKATRAASKHLKHLYNLFGDWRLVIAAYNCGQGRLDRAIQKSGSRDFWQIDSLPRETRQHLPKFMAAVIISRAPERFGFENVVYEAPLAYDTVSVTEPVGLKIAAECVETTYEHLRALNPELRRAYTPPPVNRKAYSLHVPVGTAEKFQINYARVPAKKKIQIISYTVQAGETISQIAKSVGVRTSAILDANNIRNPRRVRAGTKLSIPIPPDRYARASRLKANPSIATPDPAEYRKTTYTVRRGDTLWDIARMEGVSPRMIQAWNGLRASQHIHPGNRLVIWKPEHRAPEKSPVTARSADFYTIRQGDTLSGIAQAFNTSIAKLKVWNRLQSASRIRAGAKLRVRPPRGTEQEL